MTRKLSLQDFGQSNTSFSDVAQALEPVAPMDLPPVDQADALEAYDSGYKSGWADCANAEAEERKSVAADLAKNLTDAKLTYDSARRDVLAALGPFFEDVISTLLPEISIAALAPNVVAEVNILAKRQAEADIVICAAPKTCASIERLIESSGLEALVKPEPAFSEGQVSIRAGAERRDLDMQAAASRIADAISNFRTQTSGDDMPSPIPPQGVA